MLTDSSKEESLPLSDLDLDLLVDAAGEIILRHYLARGSVFKVSNANVPLWTNIAAEADQKAMISLILKDLPYHAVCGDGTTIPEFVWVLESIDGAEERLLPTFGMSLAVVHNGKPVIGCICNYNKDAKHTYNRLAYKVGETFFNGNCIAYSELAAGMLQVVVDCAVEPYGLLGLVPIVEGAGGIITDWQPSPASSVPRNSFKVVAASDLITHQQIIFELS